MLCALDEMVVEGVKTLIPLHKELLKHAKFQIGDVHTGWVEQYMASR